MNANDWKCELNHLLEMFERESVISLRKINRCFIALDRPFDDNFRQYFLKMSTLSLDKSFSTVLFEWLNENRMQISSTSSVPTLGNEIPASTSSNVGLQNEPNLLDTKIENNVGSLIEIVDSEDEDMGDVQQIQTSENVGVESQETNHHVENCSHEQNGTNSGNEKEFEVEVNSKDEPKVENEIETVDLPLVEFDPNQDEDYSSVENGANVGEPLDNQYQPKSSSNVAEQTKRTTSKRYKCKDCSYTAQYKCHINYHQRIHAQQKKMGIPLGPNDGQYKCPHCDQQFNKWDGFRSHLTKSHKNNQRLFNCSRCMRRFARKNEKERHELRCQERHYECYLCKKYVTVTVTHMQNHMRTHSGAKPFECAICKKCFRQKSGLRYHSDFVHKPH